MLNGFGDEREMATLRADLASTHDINVAIDRTDIESPEGSASATQIRGATLTVDGGWTAQ